METPTDMEIVRRVQAGDAEAFGELVNRYSGRIYALALAMVRDAQRAEDVTQETFIRAYDHLGAYDRIDAESCAVAEESSAGRFDEETVVRMRRALERLRPDERVLVALFYEEERSLAEIAQIMNLTLSNVKVRLHRLRGRLRHYMEE